MNKILKIILLTALVLAFASCGNDAIKKPKNLIPQSTMEDILYDLAIVDGARIADPQGLTEAGLSQQGFIFEKYKIDSLQFAESNHFYTANIDTYILMYERILKKIETEKTLLDTLVKRKNKQKDSLNKAEIKTVPKEVIQSHQVFRKKKKVLNANDNFEVKK
jgi:hypothetical protein